MDTHDEKLVRAPSCSPTRTHAWLAKMPFRVPSLGMLSSVTRILTGNVLGQAISILALPIVSRIYSPDEYGIFGTALAIVAVLTVIVTLQMQQAIVLPRLDSHSFGLFLVAISGALAGGIAVLATVYLVTWIQIGAPSLSYAVLVGIAVSSTGVSQSITGLVVRAKAFTQLGAAAVLRVCAMVLTQVCLGLTNAGASGLIAGYIVGELVAATFLWSHGVPRAMRKRSFTRWKRQFLLVRRFRDFATFGTAQEAMNSASQGIPVLLLGVYFGPAVAGYYAFATRILSAPGQLLANSVRQVASQHFAQLTRFPLALQQAFRGTTFSLAVPTLICTLAILPWLPDAFACLFGEMWREAGNYGRWLIAWLAFLVFNAPSTVVMRTLRRQKESFALSLLILTTRVGLLVYGGMHGSALWTVAAFALLGVFWNIVYIGLAWYFLRRVEQ